MDKLIQFIKNLWTDSFIPTLKTKIQKERENAQDIIQAIQDKETGTIPIVQSIKENTQAVKEIPTVDFTVLSDKISELQSTLETKELSVTIGDTKVEVKPVIEGLKDLAKNLKDIEKKIPKAEKKKFIDYSKKFDAVIKELKNKETLDLSGIEKEIKSLNVSQDLSILAEWLKVIAEKEYPEIDLPRDENGYPIFTPSKVGGGGGGGLTAIQEGHLKTLTEIDYATEETLQDLVSSIQGLGGTTKFATNEFFEDGDTYFCKESSDGAWYIKKLTSAGVWGHATELNNPTVTSYAGARTGYAGLTYGNYSDAF